MKERNLKKSEMIITHAELHFCLSPLKSDKHQDVNEVTSEARNPFTR